MRSHPWAIVAILLVGAGCPSEFGVGGRIDKAVRADTKQPTPDCPEGRYVKLKDPDCTGDRCDWECVDD